MQISILRFSRNFPVSQRNFSTRGLILFSRGRGLYCLFNFEKLLEEEEREKFCGINWKNDLYELVS